MSRGGLCGSSRRPGRRLGYRRRPAGGWRLVCMRPLSLGGELCVRIVEKPLGNGEKTGMFGGDLLFCLELGLAVRLSFNIGNIG